MQIKSIISNSNTMCIKRFAISISAASALILSACASDPSGPTAPSVSQNTGYKINVTHPYTPSGMAGKKLVRVALVAPFSSNSQAAKNEAENMKAATALALKKYGDGKEIALVSDAGTPCVSDPGQRLAQIVLDAGFEIYPIPGASSVLAGLVASGLEAKQFAFLGFIPNKQKARRDFFTSFKDLKLTLIFFETGPRLLASLNDMFEILGDRKIAVTRELTKLYEEKKRGQLQEVLQHYNEKGEPKGEIVIIIEGNEDTQINYNENQIEKLIIDALKTQSVKSASQGIAKITGLKSRDIYEMAIKLKQK